MFINTIFMEKKNRLLLMGLMCMSGIWMASAQQQPIVLFPAGAPGETTKLVEKGESDGNKVGGETVLRVTNVSEPTITIYPAPEGRTKTNSAVIICPGGGYSILAYDLEGTEVCQWLNSLGITGVLLKYRVPRKEGRAKHEAPLQDVQRAIGYVRAHANQYGLDEKKIGVMGFSAGAHLAATVSNNFSERTYPVIDEADRASCRPDFCLLVYPAYLDAANFQTSPEVKVTSQTPPTMLIQAEDDKPLIKSSIYYYNSLMETGVPAWMHLYSKGGHGYGLRDTGATVNEWPFRVEDWFREIGVIQ
jgi:acetyl esterase/lipase